MSKKMVAVMTVDLVLVGVVILALIGHSGPFDILFRWICCGIGK